MVSSWGMRTLPTCPQCPGFIIFIFLNQFQDLWRIYPQPCCVDVDRMGAIDPVLELLRCRAAAFLIIRSLIESVARSHVALSFAMLAVASART